MALIFLEQVKQWANRAYAEGFASAGESNLAESFCPAALVNSSFLNGMMTLRGSFKLLFRLKNERLKLNFQTIGEIDE
jgi:hypothetical protein